MGNLNNKSKNLLNLITKYCVLSIIAITSTQIVNLLQIVLFLIVDIEESKDHYNFNELVIFETHRLLIVIDMIINVISLFLTTNYTLNYYKKICKYFHNSIKKTCNKWSTTKAIKNRTKRQTDYQIALLDEEDEDFHY